MCYLNPNRREPKENTLFEALRQREASFFVKRDEKMDLLYEAAAAWQKLIACAYRITYGKSGVLHTITLKFDAGEFYHLAGFQYLRDLALPVRFSHAKAIDAMLTGKITEAHIAKSENYEAIKERLTAITRLQAALDTSFKVFRFNPDVLPFYTKIKAENLILAKCGEVVFLFTDQAEDGTAFSKSIFLKRADRDFSKNQKLLSVLKVERDGQVLYKSPNFMD